MDYWIKRVEKLNKENEELKARLHRYEREDVIAVQVWCREDIAVQLEGEGFEPSDENIDIVLNEGIAKSLSDCTTGNEMIEYTITGVDEKLKWKEDEPCQKKA